MTTGTNNVNIKAKLTQKQRSEVSRRKLMNATIESLIELGYSQTSIQEVCKRAGLSKGGLFRQFPSRTELMVATCQQVYTDLLTSYKQQFECLEDRSDPIRNGLTLIRKSFANAKFQAAIELQVAARTDKTLAEGIAPILESNHKTVVELSKSLFPEVAKRNSQFDAVIDTVVLMFRGEVLGATLYNNVDDEDARMSFIEQVVKRALLKDE